MEELEAQIEKRFWMPDSDQEGNRFWFQINWFQMEYVAPSDYEMTAESRPGKCSPVARAMARDEMKRQQIFLWIAGEDVCPLEIRLVAESVWESVHDDDDWMLPKL